MLFVDKKFASKSPKALAVALRRTSSPQTIYLSSGKPAFPVLIYACALVNLVFWGNLSQWVYSDYSVKDEKTQKFQRASIGTRLTYSGGLAVLGLGISTGFLLVSKRIVKRIDMLRGGEKVAIYTGFFGKDTARHGIEVPVADLSLKRSLYTGEGHNLAISSTGSYTQMNRSNQLIGYLIDRRGSFFSSPRVLDELFYRDRQGK